MHRRTLWFFLLLVAGLMLACVFSPHGYQKTNNIFTGDSYIFATSDERSQYVEYPLQNIDARSFQILDKYTYAKDNFHVYYQGRTMEGADSASFSIPSVNHGKDKAHVYFKGAIIPGADPKSFKSLDDEWGKDSRAAYYHLQPFKLCDPETFVFLGNPGGTVWEGDSEWEGDNQCIYSDGRQLPDADPVSFVALSTFFGKDKTHVYFSEKIIQGADPATFKVKGPLDSIEGQDKNGCYQEDIPGDCTSP